MFISTKNTTVIGFGPHSSSVLCLRNGKEEPYVLFVLTEYLCMPGYDVAWSFHWNTKHLPLNFSIHSFFMFDSDIQESKSNNFFGQIPKVFLSCLQSPLLDISVRMAVLERYHAWMLLSAYRCTDSSSQKLTYKMLTDCNTFPITFLSTANRRIICPLSSSSVDGTNLEIWIRIHFITQHLERGGVFVNISSLDFCRNITLL